MGSPGSMSRRSTEILRLRLRCDLSAPRRPRRALAGLEAIDPVRDDALLVASELATTALRRATHHAENEIELVAEVVPDGLRIAVSDRWRTDAGSTSRHAGEGAPRRARHENRAGDRTPLGRGARGRPDDVGRASNVAGPSRSPTRTNAARRLSAPHRASARSAGGRLEPGSTIGACPTASISRTLMKQTR
jgi:hypothetical protein